MKNMNDIGSAFPRFAGRAGSCSQSFFSTTWPASVRARGVAPQEYAVAGPAGRAEGEHEDADEETEPPGERRSARRTPGRAAVHFTQ